MDQELKEKILRTSFHSHDDYRDEVERYLSTMVPYYLRLLKLIDRFHKRHSLPLHGSVAEIGSYTGYFSATLKRIYGSDIYGVDHPNILSSAVRDLYQSIGIRPFPVDFHSSNISLPSRVDVYIFCETLEHLHLNNIELLRSINLSLNPEGFLFLTVPNIASLRNRFKLLFGRQILTDFTTLEDAISPDSLYGVHWHEYTLRELEGILKLSGFRVCEKLTVNIPTKTWKYNLKELLGKFSSQIGDSLLILAKKV
jgi:SAM-dependent methyltransferase